jgi:MoaA/NifB/PqqE/SkfB family radical SAM enzyme
MSNRTAHCTDCIAPREITFHVTYRCPLKCSFCCFSSDMSKTGHLDLAGVLAAIDDAGRILTISRIHFVGGDPFLHQDIMREAFAHARARGLEGGAVTSAYWASSAQKAITVLRPLAEAGLTRLTVSYDDAHAEFVGEANIVYACKAARSLEVEVLIAVVREPGSKIDAKYIEALLDLPAGGDDLARVYETAVNSTGRALENASEEEQERRRGQPLVYRGPCRSMLRHFSVNPEGKILPCCGVIPLREGLVAGDSRIDRFDDIVRRSFNDWVFKWIAFEGPVALLRQVTQDSERPCRDEDFDGVCHACDVLFTSPEHQEQLRRALPAKIRSLQIQEQIYSALGRFIPPAPADEPDQRPAETVR